MPTSHHCLGSEQDEIESTASLHRPGQLLAPRFHLVSCAAENVIGLANTMYQQEANVWLPR